MPSPTTTHPRRNPPKPVTTPAYTRRLDAISILSFEPEAVERPNPTSAPTAFRIWRAGANPTDHGPTFFTPRSAELLMAEQEIRGNMYAIDIDHLSMSKDAPIAARRAVGWHYLQVRDSQTGPELWAVDVEWSADIKAGLEALPPEWKYFSPAYDVNDTGEVIRYLKLALTNDPATWNVTALANRQGGPTATPTKGSPMKKSELMAALKAAAAADPNEAHGRIKGLLSAMDLEGEGEIEEAPPSSAPAVEVKPEPEAVAAAAEPAAEPVAEVKPEPVVEDRVAAMASRLQALEATLAKKAVAEERAKLLASRTDLAKEVKAWLTDSTTPIETVRKAIATLPKATTPNLAADVTVKATRSEGQASQGEAVRATRSTPEVAKEIADRMGIASAPTGITHDGHGNVTYNRLTKEQAQQILARRNGAGK